MKALIAFFSRAGENYVNGRIEDLQIGNTEIVAQMIREYTGADLYKIEPYVEYSKSYSDCIDEAKEDQRRDARPVLKSEKPELGEYDVIFLGYPNYWGTMPMLVFSFLEKCKLADKRIIPFCTHEGSGIGRSISDIRRLCPKATLGRELVIRGAFVRQSEEQIAAWLRENNHKIKE